MLHLCFVLIVWDTIFETLPVCHNISEWVQFYGWKLFYAFLSQKRNATWASNRFSFLVKILVSAGHSTPWYISWELTDMILFIKEVGLLLPVGTASGRKVFFLSCFEGVECEDGLTPSVRSGFRWATRSRWDVWWTFTLNRISARIRTHTHTHTTLGRVSLIKTLFVLTLLAHTQKANRLAQ